MLHIYRVEFRGEDFFRDLKTHPVKEFRFQFSDPWLWRSMAFSAPPISPPIKWVPWKIEKSFSEIFWHSYIYKYDLALHWVAVYLFFQLLTHSEFTSKVKCSSSQEHMEISWANCESLDDRPPWTFRENSPETDLVWRRSSALKDFWLSAVDLKADRLELSLGEYWDYNGMYSWLK